MSLKIRKSFEPGRQLAYALEDPATGKFFDFRTKTFDDDPANSLAPLGEAWKSDAANLGFLRGAYANVDPDDRSTVQLDTPAEVFTSDYYTVYYVDERDVGRVVAMETWVAEKVGDKVELRPRESFPPMPRQDVASGGPTIHVNIPPGLNLMGKLAIALGLDQPIPGITPEPPPPPPPAPTPIPPPPAPPPEPVSPDVTPAAAARATRPPTPDVAGNQSRRGTSGRGQRK
jgi:hypothetical protein